MLYNLIAYKSDGVDICRGCVMERYSSDFMFEPNLEESEVVRYLSQLVYSDETESGPKWSVYILETALECDQSSEPNTGGTEYKRLMALATVAAKERLAKEKLKDAEKEEKTRREVMAIKEQQEQERYQRLKQKYEPGK